MITLDLFGEPVLEIQRGAVFSEPCKTWRYSLWRSWDKQLPRLLCVLLNPSTADGEKDDPTNQKCIKWAMANAFGSLTFCNLFAFRSPHPKIMMAAPEPVGPDNDEWIQAEMIRHDVIVAGWGNNGDFMGRDKVVFGFHNYWKCFGLNPKSRHPRHPLYMRDASKLIELKEIP